MKTKLVATLLFVLFFVGTYAQKPVYKWAKAIDGVADEYPGSIITDVDGNVYGSGAFESDSITAGTYIIKNVNPIGIGYNDGFLVKYDKDGNIIWAKGLHGTEGETISGLLTDNSGNIYMAGAFGSNTIEIGNVTLTKSAGKTDIYLAKLDKDGNTIWAKSFGGGQSRDYGGGLAMDKSGNIYLIAGFTSGSIDFGTGALTNTSSYIDMALVKFDADGNTKWAKKAGGTGNDFINNIFIKPTDNVYDDIYIVGYGGEITFGSITLESKGGHDAFIAKYNTNGDVQWANVLGGTERDYALAVTSDIYGGIYVTGYHESPTFSANGKTITNAQSLKYDAFVAKYNSAGNILWLKGIGGAESENAYSIVSDNAGNVLLGGSYLSKTLTVDGISLNITAEYQEDIYVFLLDSSGKAKWAQTASGQFTDMIRSIALDSAGDIYVYGNFKSKKLDFGSYSVLNPLSNVGGTSNIFITKLETQKPVGITEIEENELNIYPNPSNGKFTLATESKINSVQVYNAIGKLVYSGITGVKIIDISLQPKGMYFVTINMSDKIYIQKVIVE